MSKITEIVNIQPIQSNAQKTLSSNNAKTLKIVIIVGIVIAVVVSFSLGIYFFIKKRRKKQN